MSSQFEFNDKLLTFIADDLHSCKYGNFFYNNEFERQQMKVSEKTISIWTVVNLYKDCEFRNPGWVGDISRMSRVTSIGTFDTWDLRFWREFFCRFSEQVQAKEN